jgi:hypothetical protein
MGEYASFYIDGYKVDSWKSSIGEGALLFSEEDMTQTPHPYCGGDEDAEGYYDDDDDDEEEEGEESWRGYQYRNTAGNIIDRMEIMGLTLDSARKRFEEGVGESLRYAREYREQGHRFVGDDIPFYPLNPSHPEAVEYLEGYTFDLWLGLLKSMFEQKLERISFNQPTDLQRQNPYLYYVLERGNDNDFGFPVYGGMHMYRAMLEVVSPEALVILDFSTLVGWTAPEQYLSDPPTTVIMTEGSSDKRILEETLRILYPHLHPYYSFIDFDLANMPGSTGHLLNIVKAFIATGVRHRTIAIFDNDSAGHDALRQITKLPLPDNIKAIALPHLPLATSYPTVGPQGRIETDINGLACSLELYLGRDILNDPSGDLTPVQWGGLMPGVKRYQGEITNKAAIQERYFSLLSAMSVKTELIETHDWSGMRSVLQSLFDLFKDQPVFEYE